jgi:hypothetical protein
MGRSAVLNNPVLNKATPGKRVRIRRSWYRRRLRFRRTLLAVVVAVIVAAAFWQNAVSYLSSPAVRSSQAAPDSRWTRGNVHKNLALVAAQSPQPDKSFRRIPGVYPYSVVPGGVKDPEALRYAALRDAIVRRHFAHFDFNNARLVHATEAQQVYLSYRIRDTVYWTRKKVRLHPGELLLTDGNITARARCGNQISEVPMPEVSDEEPAEDVMDQPVAVAAIAPALTIRPLLAPPDLPAGQPTPPQVFASGFIFPYVPFAVPMISGYCPAGETVVDGKCHHKHKPVVPEPSTIVLLGSGALLILWRYRSGMRPVMAEQN